MKLRYGLFGLGLLACAGCYDYQETRNGEIFDMGDYTFTREDSVLTLTYVPGAGPIIGTRWTDSDGDSIPDEKYTWAVARMGGARRYMGITDEDIQLFRIKLDEAQELKNNDKIYVNGKWVTRGTLELEAEK